MANVRKIRRILTETEEELLKAAGTPPDRPLVSSDIVDSIAEACETAFCEDAGGTAGFQPAKI